MNPIPTLRLGAAVALAAMAGSAAALPPATQRLGAVTTLTPGPCLAPPDGAPEAGVVAAVAGIVVQAGVNWLGKTLEQQRDGLTGRFAAFGAQQLAVGQKVHCLRVYRGAIGPNGAPGRDALPEKSFELLADLDGTQNKFVLTPVRLHYGATSARRGSRTKNVSVVVALTAGAAPDSAPDADKALALFRLNLGELEFGKQYGAGLLKDTAVGAPLPAGTSSFNTAVYVTESKDAGPALQALVSAFDTNKDKLSEALTEAVKKALPGN